MPLFSEHREQEEYPFKILAAAFLEAGKALSLTDAFYGVMQSYRPGVDDIDVALHDASGLAVPDGVKPRRLRHMLNLLASVEAIEVVAGTWSAKDPNLLAKIAGWDIFGQILCRTFHKSMTKANLRFDESFNQRCIAALLAKKFVIMTGLAGSGKTKIAQALAYWLGCAADRGSLALVAIGPDWSSRDSILGYPDGLGSQHLCEDPSAGPSNSRSRKSDRP